MKFKQYINLATDELAKRVRRFSVAVFIFTPIMVLSQLYLFWEREVINLQSSNYYLGFALATFIVGVSFVIPYRLANAGNCHKVKMLSFFVFCLCLASVLLWFPLNLALTK
jgi:hypothetical protein